MKMKSYRYFLVILCLASVSACFVSNRKDAAESINNNAAPANTADNSKTEGAKASAEADNQIRKIDFKNFTYEPVCVGDENRKITVKNGEYALNKEDDKLYFDVTGVSYGDANGDGVEDAIVLTNCNTGGTGQFSEGFVYAVKDGKPELLTRIGGGDRAYGGLRSAKVENGLIVVARNDAGENGASCCPEFVVTSKYKLEGKNLKQIGGDDRRELYPPQRVKFDKGASDAFLDVKLTDEEEIKRFVVGAQANQELRVESNSKNVSITLVKGNADIIEDGRTFRATIKERGDFIIQIQNLGDKSHTASINFDIR